MTEAARCTRWLGLGLLLVGLASGCASGAKPNAMIPENLEGMRSHPDSVRVQSAGGRDTEWWASSQISDTAFSEALFESLSRSGVFSSVVRDGGADYQLDVFIVDVRQPVMGFNMTVSVVARWTLQRLADGEIVFEELIPTPYEASVGDAFVGVTRLRLANEGAARANIAEGIRRLSQLELGSPATGMEAAP